MAKRNLLRTALILSSSLFLCGAAAKTDLCLAQTPSQTPPPRTAQNRCASTTDPQIVTAIQEKIKADNRFDNQWRHINVDSRNRIVTLMGWVKGRAQINVLFKYARSTACVRRVINRLRPFRTVGCAPGQKVCGDICIDRNQNCNLIQ